MVKWNNLTTDKNILLEQQNKNHQDIMPEHKLFIVALYCIIKSGGVLKIEEFNGINLTPRKLFEWLLRKYSVYFKDSSLEQMMIDMQGGLVEFSEVIGEKNKNDADMDDNYIRIRYMNGLTFNKKEYLIKNQMSDYLNDIPIRLKTLAEKIGVEVSDYVNFIKNVLNKIYEFELNDGMRVADIDRKNAAMNWLDYLIYILVLDAKECCNFDYSFSSGMRDIRNLYHQYGIDVKKQVTSLKPEEFFCCINRLDHENNREVCGGMQANRWNYLCGNIDHETNTLYGRYYRYPLLYPDISLFNNYHHTGHIRLGVKHVIRVSGPTLDKKPLAIDGINYRAFYDIRGYKSGDSPFTIDDLNQAIRFCTYLDVIWRHIIYMYEKENKFIPITLFDNAFYEKRSNFAA